ncbi:O-sialoglycoprotein endopeptidase [Candidatus Protochlamydia naegleriophila]|uniref:tRNA N6-adenosine threonylcarbamoyltransferase n=1 Tax=Candidatus Protochlamydia naegleriophila TaxID=389348 RepID=A0A0U5JFT1_9BACT|nr:tRNA (adenosine(37)-N6)-threonylcarbamoyltransferase complex transferase subunit TsaD [Candidatus Protochlamydia naegleriophila]CUI16598.1 O-sialoglycoprotein endopeptidase [Candidatus Protochlamydia naegleriophila]
MLVLGIESTCDETACAIVRDGQDILANVVASQIDLHDEYGGVVPELACRRHIDLMIPVIEQAREQAKISLDDIDLIAVAHGPGLIGALLIGLNTAKALSFALQKPFIGVNHVEAHLYAALMSNPQTVEFPCLGVVLSGGHTALVLINQIGEYELIGQTVDDAVGEAFDKVAKMLDLPYPGGPQIEQLARLGNPQRHSFKAGQVKGHPLDFSFSGLKTAVLYTIRGPKGQGSDIVLTDADKTDIAASFQQAALEDIVKKTLSAANRHGIKTLLFGGGVTNNQHLRHLFQVAAPSFNYCWPSAGLSLDNAAMIAGLGYHRYRLQGKGDEMELEPLVRIPFHSKP